MKILYQSHSLLLVCAAGTLLLGACSFVNQAQRVALHKITPYRVTVFQGNVITKEQVDALKPGMTKNEVASIMGTPLLDSPFAKDQWSYVFTIKKKNSAVQEHSVTIDFKDDRLDKVDGRNVPTEAEFLASIKTNVVNPKELPALEATPAQLSKYPPETKPPAAAVAPQKRSSYPPLNSLD